MKKHFDFYTLYLDNVTSEFDRKIQHRREVVFLVLAGLFLGSLTMLNILGISRVLDFTFNVGAVKIPFILTIGVLPYPITFLCTDFISEIYGKRRANQMVWVGLILNFWVMFILYIGGILPGKEGIDDTAFFRIRELTLTTTTASMIAYLSAQFCDVNVFHFFKRLTKGKHLWLRNNASTLISQLVDSVAVILIAHWGSNAFGMQGNPEEWEVIKSIILSGYVFKMVIALLDTFPFYWGTKFLTNYLNISQGEQED